MERKIKNAQMGAIFGGEIMPETIASKSVKAVPKKPIMKRCTRCDAIKPVTDFYTNKDWDEQLGHDAWCKDCYSKCQSKEDVREYFWCNNREFTDGIWETAMIKAENQAASNTSFQRLPRDRRDRVLEKLACTQVP